MSLSNIFRLLIFLSDAFRTPRTDVGWSFSCAPSSKAQSRVGLCSVSSISASNSLVEMYRYHGGRGCFPSPGYWSGGGFGRAHCLGVSSNSPWNFFASQRISLIAYSFSLTVASCDSTAARCASTALSCAVTDARLLCSRALSSASRLRQPSSSLRSSLMVVSWLASRLREPSSLFCSSLMVSSCFRASVLRPVISSSFFCRVAVADSAASVDRVNWEQSLSTSLSSWMVFSSWVPHRLLVARAPPPVSSLCPLRSWFWSYSVVGDVTCRPSAFQSRHHRKTPCLACWSVGFRGRSCGCRLYIAVGMSRCGRRRFVEWDGGGKVRKRRTGLFIQCECSAAAQPVS